MLEQRGVIRVVNGGVLEAKVLAEVFRVLKLGGRFAVSDIVRRRDVPEAIRRSIEFWAGCVAGALSEAEYRDGLRGAGFDEVDIEPTRIYHEEDAGSLLSGADDGDLAGLASQLDGAYMSAFVWARKPKPL